jgi:hypothetical protein
MIGRQFHYAKAFDGMRIGERGFIAYCDVCHHTQFHFTIYGEKKCHICSGFSMESKRREDFERIWGRYDDEEIDATQREHLLQKNIDTK